MLDKVKAFNPQKVTTDQAYLWGYDCGKNGANLQNCSFAIFSSPENRDAWVKGKRMGEADRRSARRR